MDVRRLRGKIIEVLGDGKSLAVADIEERVNQLGGKKYSIKAFYKELQRLREDGVVVKAGERHVLRLPWVLETIAFADRLERNYIAHPSLRDIGLLEGRQVWHFNDLLKMNDFWSHLLLILIQRSKKRILLGWNPHPWFHLVQTEQEEQYVRSLTLAKSKLYLIVGGNTFLDRWTKRFLDKRTVECTFGKSPFSQECVTYINVVDDYVLTVKLNPRVAAEIDRLYNKTHSMDDLDLPAAISLFRSKTKTTIHLERNAAKAKKIKTKFKRYWGVDFS